ncbi:hypothetical protein VTJ04DRAFT_7815 [Mycothermus thermophilus]|uniref:uncharacterized protein n=1 Tax=Humicola insolens TaxID=85995 RepID=UPI003742DF39
MGRWFEASYLVLVLGGDSSKAFERYRNIWLLLWSGRREMGGQVGLWDEMTGPRCQRKREKNMTEHSRSLLVVAKGLLSISLLFVSFFGSLRQSASWKVVRAPPPDCVHGRREAWRRLGDGTSVLCQGLFFFSLSRSGTSLDAWFLPLPAYLVRRQLAFLNQAKEERKASS